MRIGNIKICKNVAKGFCVGTGLGLLTGGLVSYFYMKRQMYAVVDYYEDAIEGVCGYCESEEFDEVNPLQESNDRKAEIVNKLILRGEEYFADEEPLVNRINKIGYEMFNELEGVTPEEGDPSPIDEEEEELLMNIFDTVDEDEEDSKRISEELHDGNPYTITREQFIGSCLDFTKTTMGYYTENGMLIDEEGDPVSEGDAITIIGEHGLKKFGQDSGDDDTVYLRNPWIHTDIELVRYWEEYEMSR